MEPPSDPKLDSLSIGNLGLSPEFKGDILNYETTTTNESNTIKAIGSDVETEIRVNGDLISGGKASWVDGENTVSILVRNAIKEVEYKILVTKEE